MESVVLISTDVAGRVGSARGAATPPRLLWIIGGFDNPECAILDHDRGEIYLSCMASNGTIGAVGAGYVSRLTPQGELIEKHWISGLKNPCGIAVRGSSLYIVDCDRLLVADTASGRIVAEYPAPGATFLDGMGVDDESENIFVSDIFGNAIWRLSGGTWEKWLEHPRLDQPDGMIAERHRLVVGSFAMRRRQDMPVTDAKEWVTARKGHLLAVDYQTREITDIGTGSPIANHDGLRGDGAGGYLTTDYIDGTLLRVDENGRAEEVLYFDHFDGEPLIQRGDAPRPSCGPADIQYYPQLELLFVPLLNVGKLAAYSFAVPGQDV